MVKTALVIAFIFLLACFPVASSFASSFDSVSISMPALKSLGGSPIFVLRPGQQALIHLTVTNNEPASQPFTAIVEVRDEDGVTLNLQWQTGTLEPNGSQAMAMSWTAEPESEFEEVSIRAFAITDFENPQVLSGVKTSSFLISAELEVDIDAGRPAADYTVLVYMVGSDLESQNYAASLDIREMEAVGSTEGVNVIVETGGANAPKDEERFIDFTSVQIHRILEGEYQTLQDVGQKNMGDPQTLADFIAWSVSQYPAERYAIVLWDHGNGIDGFGFDELFEDSLTLDEIEEAFADAKQQTQADFEVIGFDACLMATVEVADRLSPYGSYLVASQEVEPSWGWDYTAILTSMTGNPDQTGDQLGRTVADTYVKHAVDNAEKYWDYESQSTVTMSVLDLKKIPALKERVRALSDGMEDRISNLEYSYSFARAVDSTERYGVGAKSSSGHVDLYHLASNIGSEFPGYNVVVGDLQQAIDDAVIYNVSGQAKPNANGISIYVPVEAKEFNDDYLLYSVAGWDSLLETQESMLQSDDEAPFIDLEFDGQTVSGSVEGADISKVLMYISSETYDQTRVEVLSYLELDPSWVIEPDGAMEFTWNKQIISLCNDEFCAPTLMNLEATEDTLFALFPVRLEAEDVNEPVTLIYQVQDDEETGSTFEFLGAWPEIDQDTASRELWPLYAGDKIYTYTYEYDLEDEEYFSYIEYEPIVVTENFQPEYFTYDGTYYLSFGVCDFSDNCSYSDEFSFVTGQSSIEEDSAYGPGNLDIDLRFEQDPIARGNVQTITVQVFDEPTEYVIEDAFVEVQVNYASGQTVNFSGHTDSNGVVTFSWRISENADPGMFEVLIDASADKYESESYSSSFEVV
jgi:hypothetical protein